MPTIYIDGDAYEIDEGRNVLQAALDHRLDLPYFCWHPAMGSVGACRLCAVKHYRDENDERGRLAMGCMTPASDGTRVAIDDPEAARFRQGVIEWLMINHPHDCPVCDEGGECHLQDMTVMTGHAHRRYRGRKRTYRNQYLGPFIHHEMNRCIQCYRCTRFYRDYSGGDDLGAFASRDRVYFGRVEDGVLESPFAGNLVEVCPTGVFTDKTLRRHYTRKWDLQSAPSICSHCSLGCNTLVGSRYGSARRVTSRYNHEVNGYWLCDRGRFGYEHLNADDRPLHPMRSRSGDDDPVAGASTAVRAAAAAGRLAAVGSPRASLEVNFALRTLAGAERFCCGLAASEQRLVSTWAAAAADGGFHVPSLQEVETADVAVVLATDLTHEAPLLDLALYRAHAAGTAVHVIGLEAGRLGGYAASVQRCDPRGTARRARWLVEALAGNGKGGSAGDDPVVETLAGAARPLVVCGTLHRTPELLTAAAELVEAIAAATGGTPWWALAPTEANALGTTMLDADLGIDVDELVTAIEAGSVEALVVGENDLFDRYHDADRLAAALRRLETLVVIDHMATPMLDVATHVLPAAAVAESNGTLVNNEGRMQRFFQVLRPADDLRPTWRWVLALMDGTDVPDWQRFDEVTAALEAADSRFAGATSIAPPAGFRQAHQPVPRMSHRHSGRNATLERDALEGLAHAAGSELPVVRRRSTDDETPLAFSMEGFSGPAPTALMTRVWAPAWNSNEAINQFQIEVGGPLHGGDPGRRIFAAVAPAPEPDGGEVRGPLRGGEVGGTIPDDHRQAATPARSMQRPVGNENGADDRVGDENGAADGMGDENGAGDMADAADERMKEEDGLLVCATARIFGSEPMSRRAAAVAELVTPDFLRLHPQRADALDLVPGRSYDIVLRGAEIEVELRARVEAAEELPLHVALIPAGYPATRWWQRPLRMRIEQAAEVR